MTSLHYHLEEIKSEFSGSLNGRCESAARLALGGGVALVTDGHWHVKSATEAGKVYNVRFDGCWSCDCPDHLGDGYNPAATVAFGGGVQATCKHILSAGACYFSNTYPAPAAFDLVIATRKRPFTTGSEDYQILWYKRAGADKVEPTGKTLLDSDIQKALGKYELVNTEAQQNQVIRRYVLAGAA
jgi:hypothetical protein